MKYYLVLFLISFFIPFTNAFAQQTVQSKPVQTKVGNPAGNPSSGNLSSILDWDEKIVNSLQPGIWGYLNKLATNITNGSYTTNTWAGADTGSVYWCTYSVIDSYNLAGISGLSKSQHAAVVIMRQFWKSAQAASLGYKYLDYPSNHQTLQEVQPGYAMFMESVPDQHTGNEHVAIVKAISINDRGDGTIETYESNSSSKSHTYIVDGWNIPKTVYPVRGFGGV